ncbi:MAG: phytoene desaturase family protein, partial [Gaiellaceae bacterium]
MRTDSVVVGSGPNGLAAAITLARAGLTVVVREGADEPGGGVRSADLTLPGFVHDLCSGVHPLVAASPFFRSAPLADHGLELVEPPAPLAHPLDDGSAVLLERSVAETAAGMGEDAGPYEGLLGPLVRDWDVLEAAALAPLLRIPRRPVVLGRFALSALRTADGLA